MHNKPKNFNTENGEYLKKQKFTYRKLSSDRIIDQTVNCGKEKEVAVAYAATADKRGKYAKASIRRSTFHKESENLNSEISDRDMGLFEQNQPLQQNNKTNFNHVNHSSFSMYTGKNFKPTACKNSCKRGGKETVCIQPKMFKCVNLSCDESKNVNIELTWLSDESFFELRWKENNDLEWNTSSKISSTRVRKKNLKRGNTYKFYVRSRASSRNAYASTKDSYLLGYR